MKKEDFPSEFNRKIKEIQIKIGCSEKEIDKLKKILDLEINVKSQL